MDPVIPLITRNDRQLHHSAITRPLSAADNPFPSPAFPPVAGALLSLSLSPPLLLSGSVVHWEAAASPIVLQEAAVSRPLRDLGDHDLSGAD